jgi:hypothetical protein
MLTLPQALGSCVTHLLYGVYVLQKSEADVGGDVQLPLAFRRARVFRAETFVNVRLKLQKHRGKFRTCFIIQTIQVFQRLPLSNPAPVLSQGHIAPGKEWRSALPIAGARLLARNWRIDFEIGGCRSSRAGSCHISQSHCKRSDCVRSSLET